MNANSKAGVARFRYMLSITLNYAMTMIEQNEQ
jgi:hypothetical protein